MFEPDKYPGLDDYYEEKHRAVLVERGEVIMYLHYHIVSILRVV